MKRLVAFGCEIDSGVGGFPEAYARAGAVAVIDLEIEYDAAVGIIGIRFADRVFSSLVPEDCAALELLDLQKRVCRRSGFRYIQKMAKSLPERPV